VSGLVDTGLEFYRLVLELRGYRQQILTADIANASTPGFKAVDLDFQEALNTVIAASQSAAASPSPGLVWLIEDPKHLMRLGNGSLGNLAASVKYQDGAAVALDGNSVDLNSEKVIAAENAVQYEAAANFASQVIKMLTIAINGSGSQQSSGA
jgi:flagellar basal-body rod protein FlgB